MTTVPTVPFLRQFLLFNTWSMKPLLFAVCVLAHYHLPVGGLAAVAVFGLVWIVLPFLFVWTAFSFPLFTLDFEIDLCVFFAPHVKLLVQFLCWLVDEIVELLGQLDFLFGKFQELLVILKDDLVFFLQVFFGNGLSFGIEPFQGFEEFVTFLLNRKLQFL